MAATVFGAGRGRRRARGLGLRRRSRLRALRGPPPSLALCGSGPPHRLSPRLLPEMLTVVTRFFKAAVRMDAFVDDRVVVRDVRFPRGDRGGRLLDDRNMGPGLLFRGVLRRPLPLPRPHDPDSRRRLTVDTGHTPLSKRSFPRVLAVDADDVRRVHKGTFMTGRWKMSSGPECAV